MSLMKFVVPVLAVLLGASACTVTKPDRYLVVPVTTTQTVKTSARTISIAKVTLPAYAKEAAIFVQNEQRALIPVEKADWGDDTERALTLSLVRNLAEISDAQVAPDPWPLGGVPEAEIRVNVERMLVDRTLTMRLNGQFSIRRESSQRRDRVGQFDIIATARSNSPVDIAQAHGEAWQELALLLAKEL